MRPSVSAGKSEIFFSVCLFKTLPTQLVTSSLSHIHFLFCFFCFFRIPFCLKTWSEQCLAFRSNGEDEPMCTFVEPVSDPVEDDLLLPRGREPEGVALHVWLVVDVVFEDVDLRRQRETRRQRPGKAVDGSSVSENPQDRLLIEKHICSSISTPPSGLKLPGCDSRGIRRGAVCPIKAFTYFTVSAV